MGILDRAFQWVEQSRKEIKSAKIPFDTGGIAQYDRNAYLYPWTPVSWIDTSWRNLVDQIYLVNSAVGQCILVLTMGYPEPPPRVLRNGDPVPDHPLQRLLDRPNPQMSHSELMVYSIVYRAIGGNVYLHKVRNSAGVVVELWPYHAGQLWPVPNRFNWVDEFEYEVQGERKRIPAKDIVHLKWPMVDLTAPYKALSPLIQVAREVLSDSEATKMQAGLLSNDAVPRGFVTIPPDKPMPPKVMEKIRRDFYDTHGGDNRGGLGFLENGATYQRVSLNMQELDFSALRKVPETRIAGAFKVPPIVAGLSVGLERATYSNYEQAVTQMTRGTFVPLWRSDAVELTQGLSAEFNGDTIVTYDTNRVGALQESEDKKYTRATGAFNSNGVVLDEFRAMLGFPPIADVVQGSGRGLLLSDELKAEIQQQGQMRIVDVTPVPAQLTEDQ